ncbi:O-Antigen ligase [Enhygromyxa salina]|uniref:O-Antigen ligase n=2 Tax=Enhygromyxa salina TaxID=215803 RepID=A0A2S9YSS4_9BACT|nr:O-Antigen ligase [Enhygromyxa salina]
MPAPHHTSRRPAVPTPAASGAGREVLCGFALALFLVSGSWSLARVAGVEPMVIWQPRVWAVIVLVALAFMPARGRAGGRARGRSVLGAELAWLGFSLVSITWAPELELAEDQAVDLALLIAVAVALHRLAHTSRIERLASTLRSSLLVLLLGLAALALLGGVGGRMAVLGGGPNVFGRNMGLLCLLALERALCFGVARSRSRGWWLPVWALVACVAAGLVALSGSRGAMISTVIAAGLLLMLGRARLSRRLAVALGVLGLFVGLLVLTPLGDRVIESFASRVLNLLVADRYVSSRDQIYLIALEGGATRPIAGHGLASFAAQTPWPYAHNLALDAWFETGAIGVALLGLYLGRSALLLARVGTSGRELWVAIALLILVGAQFSGGRYDARALLVCVALALALPRPMPRVRRSP